MKRILLIDTSEAKCSVAMAENETIIAEISSGNGAQQASAKSDHSEKLALYIDEIIRKCGSFDAVAVNVGPGSYTGLRIGLSTAKGLCYGGNKPLIAVDSLTALAQGAIAQYPDIQQDSLLLPMIDARRMEVYCAEYNACGVQLTDVQPLIVDKDTNFDISKNYYIFGSGASKCIEQLLDNGLKVTHLEIEESAANMAKIAQKRLSEGITEDVAYIEPFYLKEWQPAVPCTSKK